MFPNGTPASGRSTRSASPADGATRSPTPCARKGSRPRSIIRCRRTGRRAYRDYPVAEGGLAVTEKLSGEVISLPMHAYLDEPTQDRIVAAVRTALAT